MRPNPFTIGLLAAGGISLVLAFMAANVAVQMTDYATFDTFEVGMVVAWMLGLIVIGVVAITGAIVIAGVAWASNARNPELLLVAPTGIEPTTFGAGDLVRASE